MSALTPQPRTRRFRHHPAAVGPGAQLLRGDEHLADSWMPALPKLVTLSHPPGCSSSPVAQTALIGAPPWQA